jgi:glycosyltransferase involved in cell wall biosynthesis
MKLVVVSHKVCWTSTSSPSGYATDGGFALQMGAISELFDETRVIVPVTGKSSTVGEVHISGRELSIVALGLPRGREFIRKLMLPTWLVKNLRTIIREINCADAVHAPIPGDVGTIGLLVAMILHKPLFVRHCGNWFVRRTVAEYFWRWLLERSAGGRIVVLATGGAEEPPSKHNASVGWIFSTSLRESELNECASDRREFQHAGPRLIIAARQEREKGTAAIIESLPLLEVDYPTISLDVVGSGSALQEFRAIAERAHVANRVRFHGNVDHNAVIALLKTAHLFCFPTTSSEGFPKAVIEALACGLPVVSTRVSVLGKLLEAGGGLAIDAATPAEVARGVRWCMADAKRYETLSCAAVRTASQYSLERWRDTIGSLLTPSWGPLSSLNV